MGEGNLNTEEHFRVWITDDLTRERARQRDPFLLYVLEGQASVQVDGNLWMFHSYDFIAVNSGSTFSYTMPEAGLVGGVSFSCDLVKDYLNLRENEIVCSSFQTNADMAKAGELIRGILEASMTGADKALQMARIYQLLAYIRKNLLQKRKMTILGDTDDTAAKKQQIMDYIQKNFRRKVTLEDLAEETYFSKNYLSKYITRQFGTNFYSLLTDVRLRHVREELSSQDKSITRISMDNGFSAVNQMNKVFREKYGVSPSEYRENLAHTEDRHRSSDEPQPVSRKVQEFVEKHNIGILESDSNAHEVNADLSQARNLRPFWSSMINIGPAESLLRADVQNHVLLLQRELKMSYVRFWDLYSPDMMIFSADRPGHYNFVRLDTAIDFLIEHNMHPFIELGFKPILLLKSAVEPIQQVERKFLFRSNKYFADFVSQMLRHYSERFGSEEVDQWVLELWCDTKLKDPTPYFAQFSEIYHAVKGVSKNIQIGGPGISDENWITPQQIIEAWKRESCHPDFFSFYGYPYNGRWTGLERDVPSVETDFDQRYVGINFLPDQAGRLRDLLHKNGFWDQELYYTEWNFTVANRNMINDSVFKGAYIMRNLLMIMGKVDLAGYWFGSDLFTEYYDTLGLLDGSGGLVSKDGICKPALYGIQFCNRLGRYLLASDENCAVTTDMRGNYFIVCHNYQHPNYLYYRTREINVTAENLSQFFGTEKKKFVFRIGGVRNGTYQVKVRTLDAEHGSVLNEWKRMNMAQGLSHADLDYLRKICVPQISMYSANAEAESLSVSCTLEPNAIMSIHIYLKHDET